MEWIILLHRYEKCVQGLIRAALAKVAAAKNALRGSLGSVHTSAFFPRFLNGWVWHDHN